MELVSPVLIIDQIDDEHYTHIIFDSSLSPEGWGIVLADTARHLAAAHGGDPKSLKAMVRAFNAEIIKPTSELARRH